MLSVLIYCCIHFFFLERLTIRNTPIRGRRAGEYLAKYAHQKTINRYCTKTKNIVLTDQLKERISGLMECEKWSPELISKRLAKETETTAS